MNELIVFAVQLGISLSMSLIVLYLIKPYLKDVLSDTCGTEHSAMFWVSFTQLMMIIAPLVIVMFFSVVDRNLLMMSQPAYILKLTLLQTLTGEFVGLIFVGRTINRAINTTVEENRAAIYLQNTSTTETVQA